MKNILPVKYPMITSWTWIANTFAVLENYDDSSPWIFNNFVQLFCEIYDKWISIHYIPHVEIFSVCPFFHSALIPREIIRKFGKDIVSFIKGCLNEQYYVYCKMDESFASRQYRFLHELMIYGYNDQSREFNIADFTLSDTQKYTFSTISYDKLKSAYETVGKSEDDMQDGVGGEGGMLIYSFNKNYKYTFDLTSLVCLLEDYLNCIDSGSHYRTYKLNEESSFSKGLKEIKYGTDIYYEIINYYLDVQNGSKDFYIQPLHVLYDHKKLMVSRLFYLKNVVKLNIPDQIIANYKTLFKQTELLRNIGIKYWITQKSELLSAVPSLLNSIKAQEIELIHHLIKVSM